VIDIKTIRASRSSKLVPVERPVTTRTFKVAYLVLPNYDTPRQEEGAAPPAPKGDGDKQSA
jgi:hypothetical protein